MNRARFDRSRLSRYPHDLVAIKIYANGVNVRRCRSWILLNPDPSLRSEGMVALLFLLRLLV
jgi:hypothetical protein